MKRQFWAFIYILMSFLQPKERPPDLPLVRIKICLTKRSFQLLISFINIHLNFAEWVRHSGFEEWVFGVSGMGVVGCNLIGLSLNKKKWRGLQTMPCGLGITWRTSLVLGGLRTRSILGGSVLGGDNVDGGADELPTATMGAISSILGATKLVWSPCCFSLSLLFS